ncbi:MAG TPA: hypothetical protein VLA72_08320 [Anaerolineales bacterium]|nr:hypothetical protein [Anaerolineales bacterium]
MFRQIVIILILTLILAACGGAAPAMEEPAMTEEPAVADEPAASAQEFSAEPTAELFVIDTATPNPTEVLATPTETSLPPIEMPALLPNAPALLAWDGTPTYLGDSLPGFDFRVMYDPEIWALTEDQFGYPAVAHRGIEYCAISVTSGRGLPANISVEQDILYTDKVTLYVGSAFEEGVKKFVTYTGGDGTIITAFMVSFEEQADECLADAEAVVTTLRSVPASLATPES